MGYWERILKYMRGGPKAIDGWPDPIDGRTKRWVVPAGGLDVAWHPVNLRSACSVMVVLAAIISLATMRGATQVAPRVDRSTPPSVADSAEGFTVRRLSEPVPIDGRTWIAIESVSAAGPFRAPNGRFTLTLEEAKDHAGDVVRFRVFFTEGGGARVQLDPDVAAYAYISPDSRWIVSDPLEVVDVLNWRRYSLSKSFKVNPYVVLRAISADGRRLFISRHVCASDCQNIPPEYFEIGFPAV